MRLVPETSALSPELRGHAVCFYIYYQCSRRMYFRQGRWQILPAFAQAAIICRMRGNGVKSGEGRQAWRWLVWLAGGFFCFLMALLLASCQALTGSEAAEAIASAAPTPTMTLGLTRLAAESQAIRGSATAEREMARATIAAASTHVAEKSRINAALGATLRASYTATPAVRAVVVNAADMGSSLEGDMMNEAEGGLEGPLRVTNLSTALATNPNTGCSSGAVRQFRSTADRIFVTALVSALQNGSLFEIDWQYEGQTVFRDQWRSDYAKASECIWFYATAAYFPFLPGSYTATLYADGAAVGSVNFSIDAN